MSRRALALGLLPALVLVVLTSLAAPAAAHPLGNFTVNTADRVLLVDGGVEVTHLVDLAEIPSVQLRGQWDTDRDDRLSPSELDAYAARTCADDAVLLRLSVDGDEAPLSLGSATAEVLPGQGGLPTTRLTCELVADVDPRGEVVFSDDSSLGRTGWREVVAAARCGSVTGADVPSSSPSALLTAYPEDLLSAPLDVRSASFTAGPGPCGVPGDDEVARAERTALPRGLGGIAAFVTDFLGRDALTVPFALASAVVALVFGAVHALAPGHGKTVLAAYLVGQRGTRRQALQLGAVVTFTHTASVLLLGAVLALGTLAAPERVVPITEVASGVLLGLVGVYLLVLAVRRRRGDGAHGHGHGHGAHDHVAHDHDHDPHDHVAHDHAGTSPTPAARRSSPDGGRHAVTGDDDVTLAGGLAVRAEPLEHPHPHDHEHPHPHDHEHPHDQPHPHEHDHDSTDVVQHSHGGRAHSHALPEGPLTWRSLAAMGVAGGVVPSPSALVVLLGATYLGRAWFGVVLVLLYGLGMAATLTVAGLLLLRAQAALDRRGWAFGRGTALGRALPLLTAGVVIGVGLVLVVRGLGSATALG